MSFMQASALAAVAVSVGEWQKFRLPVGECGELMFTKETVGKIFELQENGGNGTEKWVSIPILLPPPLFSPTFVPFSSTTSCHNPPQPISHGLRPLFPHVPPRSPMFPHFPPFSSISPIFPISPDSKILVW